MSDITDLEDKLKKEKAEVPINIAIYIAIYIGIIKDEIKNLTKERETLLVENKEHERTVLRVNNDVKELEADNKSLRDGIEKIINGEYFWDGELYELKKKLYNLLLSTPLTPIPKDKEAIVFGGTHLCHKCGQLSLNCICKDKDKNMEESHKLSKSEVDSLMKAVEPKKEWSDWYPYNGRLNFRDFILDEMECELDGGLIQSFDKDYVGIIKRYRINLDGVKVITDPGFSSIQTIHSVRGYSGNDLSNKIIIIEE